MRKWVTSVSLFLAAGLLAAAAQAREATVSLELATAKGFPVGGQQRWIQFLKDVGFTSLRIRTAGEREGPSLSKGGTTTYPNYRVTGILKAGNRLQLPGAVIKLGDRAAIRDWFTRLKEEGEEGLTNPTGLWGMTAKQVIAFHQALEKKVTIQTKGKPVADVVRQITQSVDATIVVDPSASSALASRDIVLDELRGMSSGTAVAVAIRPLGLLMVPARPVAGRHQGKIVDAQQVEEGWPIGFEPDHNPGKTAPALFKFLNAEIDQEPLDQALEVLQQRVAIPILFDHNAIAKQEIDLASEVSFKPRRTFYMRIIDSILREAMLKSELRVDDAGQPFLWVTTIKKS
jgi:hypothetical protein